MKKMAAGSPFISVIVPVFNQWELVPILLERLQAQTLDRDRFELLLVDNGSDCLPDLADTPLSVQRLTCITPGSYAARNHGARYAKGEVLAFTDADCRPRPQWLAEGERCFCRDGGATRLVAGAVSIVAMNPSAPNPYELYDIMLGLPQEVYVRRDGFAVTANLFIPRPIYDRLGGFDAKRFSGGDVDFSRRATAIGVELLYCADALVEHPARDSLNALTTKVRRVKAGQLASGSWQKRLFYILHAFSPPVRGWWRLLRMPQFSPRQKFIVSVIQLRLWMTKMGEVLRLILGRKPERR